jgi:hypothetical protein
MEFFNRRKGIAICEYCRAPPCNRKMATSSYLCSKCNGKDFPTRGCPDYCINKQKYEAQLKDRGYARFEPEATDAGFRPATKQDIRVWVQYWSSPEGQAAARRVDSMIAAAKAGYRGHKFDVLSMEGYLDQYVWPSQMAEHFLGPEWLAYEAFGKEQRELKIAYDLVKNNIRTNEAYNKAEEAYKALLSHINTHGQLIREKPNREHKKLIEEKVSAPKELGRRAQRKLNNDMIDTKYIPCNRMVEVQSYAIEDE